MTRCLYPHFFKRKDHALLHSRLLTPHQGTLKAVNCQPNPSPKSTLTLKSHLGQNGRLGKGWVDTSPDSYPEPHILCQQMTTQVQNVSQLKVFCFLA